MAINIHEKWTFICLMFFRFSNQDELKKDSETERCWLQQKTDVLFTIEHCIFFRFFYCIKYSSFITHFVFISVIVYECVWFFTSLYQSRLQYVTDVIIGLKRLHTLMPLLKPNLWIDVKPLNLSVYWFPRWSAI